MGIGTAIGMGFGLLGSAISARGAGKAANAQVDASREAQAKELEYSKEALDLYRQMWEEEKVRWAPWQAAGKEGLDRLTAGIRPGGEFAGDFGPDDFKKDPGYDFRMAEGEKALQRSQAAKGGLLSGAAAKASLRYGQDYASNEYQNAYDRFNTDRRERLGPLYALTGYGQNAASQESQAGSQYAAGSGALLSHTGGRLSDLIQGAGNARASGYASRGSIWGQGFADAGNSLTSTLLLKQLLKKRGGGSNPYAGYDPSLDWNSYDGFDPRTGT